jgi:hypothetical protein
MADVLNLIYSGGTVSLNSGDYRQMDYTPRTGADSDEFVTESAEIEIGGATYANVQANIDAVERAFAQADRWRKQRVGERVYVSYQPDGYAAPMASEIVEARLELSPAARSRAQWGVRLPRALLTWKRRNYWQGAKTQLAITNPNGTANTTGLRVYNCNDGAVADTSYYRHNYFTVDGDDIAGDLPAPVEIRIAGSSELIRLENLYLSAIDAANWNQYSETLGWAYPAPIEVNDANSSGGKYQDAGFPSSTNWSNYFQLMTVDTGAGARPYNLLVRFGLLPATPGEIQLLNLAEYKSSVVRIGDRQLHLLDVYTPRAMGTYDRLDCRFRGVTVGVDGDLGIDYIACLPAERFAHIVSDVQFLIGPAIPVVYDSSEPDRPSAEIWDEIGTSTLVRRCVSYGPGLFLTPGKDHTFSMLWDSRLEDLSDTLSVISEYMTLKLSYYPRRRTL